MTVEEALAEHLVVWPSVTALAGSRVYQLKLPQSSLLPAVRVQLIDDPRNYHLRGPDKLSRARVQIDNYADEVSGSDPYRTVSALADAVEEAISGRPFALGSPADIKITGSLQIDRRALYENEELRQLRIMLDYIVWSKQLN